MEHDCEVGTNCNFYTWNNPQRLGKGTGRLRSHRTRENHSDYSIIKISLDTEKSPGDLSRLAIIQTPVKKKQPRVNAGVKKLSKE